MTIDVREQVVDHFILHLPKHLGIKAKHNKIIKDALVSALHETHTMIIPGWQSRIITESQIKESKEEWLKKSAERQSSASWRQDIPVR